MLVDRLQPSLLNFLSGITAAVAINLSTTLTLTGTALAGQPWKLYLTAVPWAASAALLAIVASMVDQCRHRAEIAIARTHEEEERAEIYQAAFGPISRLVTGLLIVTLVLIGLGVYLFSSLL